MRHNVRGRKLNRNASHRKAMFRNLVTSLFRHERVETTTQKAKEARSLAERLITYAKAGDLNSRRMAARKLYDPAVLKKLFEEIGPRYKDRPGGYTRVLKIDGRRHGDNAEVAILELVEAEFTPKDMAWKNNDSAAPADVTAAADDEAVAAPAAEDAATEEAEAPVEEAAPEAVEESVEEPVEAPAEESAEAEEPAEEPADEAEDEKK